MRPVYWTIFLLLLSNVFMTFAWYAHLRELSTKPWFIAALVSWGIALFEYLLQVPANRIGYQELNLGQLKILQEVLTLTVFVPFAVFYMKEPLKLDYLWAGTCSRYSNSAMPQLTMAATYQGRAASSFRCAYQAKVMNTLLQTSSSTKLSAGRGIQASMGVSRGRSAYRWPRQAAPISPAAAPRSRSC